MTKRKKKNNKLSVLPKFSVSMSVYQNDKPENFREAVNSVLNQTIPPSELILVVDGPVPEKTRIIIENYEYSNYNLKPVWLHKNVGHGEARRIGLSHCSYEIIALMDSDDISLHDRFEKQLVCFVRDKQLCIVGGQIREFMDGDRQHIVGVRKVALSDGEIKLQLKKQCPMNQMSVMFRKSPVLNAGGYLDWYCNEDYYLWIRLVMNGFKFKNLEDILVDVRVGKDMYQRRGGWKYFKSEVKLQGYMLSNNIITRFQYVFNVVIRFIIQLLMPNWLRSIFFRKIFRKM